MLDVPSTLLDESVFVLLISTSSTVLAVSTFIELSIVLDLESTFAGSTTS